MLGILSHMFIQTNSQGAGGPIHKTFAGCDSDVAGHPNRSATAWQTFLKNAQKGEKQI